MVDTSLKISLVRPFKYKNIYQNQIYILMISAVFYRYLYKIGSYKWTLMTLWQSHDVTLIYIYSYWLRFCSTKFLIKVVLNQSFKVDQCLMREATKHEYVFLYSLQQNKLESMAINYFWGANECNKNFPEKYD